MHNPSFTKVSDGDGDQVWASHLFRVEEIDYRSFDSCIISKRGVGIFVIKKDTSSYITYSNLSVYMTDCGKL